MAFQPRGSHSEPPEHRSRSRSWVHATDTRTTHRGIDGCQSQSSQREYSMCKVIQPWPRFSFACASAGLDLARLHVQSIFDNTLAASENLLDHGSSSILMTHQILVHLGSHLCQSAACAEGRVADWPVDSLTPEPSAAGDFSSTSFSPIPLRVDSSPPIISTLHSFCSNPL